MSSSSSSSSSSKHKKFDVFLSFRGDTRAQFTSHLYARLEQQGMIYTFKDEYALERGQIIAPALLAAIENSRCAVVVISQEYASSTWCLKELTKIVESHGPSEHILPIFYRVDLSDLREKKGKFGEELEKHRQSGRHTPEELLQWENALKAVANIAGSTVDHTIGDEAKFIEDFIHKELTKTLGVPMTKTLKGLYGMQSRIKKLDSLVAQSSSDVCFIGVHGMGGIGKSALARTFYDHKRVSNKFDGASILANVRETCEKTENGLVRLQKQLLSDIIGPPKGFGDIDTGVELIKSRLRSIRVIVVIDDIDNSDQLKALADEGEWFGKGSIITVTTRDKTLLRERFQRYEATELDSKESLQLFSWNAFKNVHPPKDFAQLSKRAVDYAHGHPLALQVLGSRLHDCNVDEWESELESLKKHPKSEIIEILERSYHPLEPLEKDVFLDIACFFNGKDRTSIMEIVKIKYGLSLDRGIKTLIDKSLLTSQHGNSLWMHDLLQQMGKGIVRKKAKNRLGRQSRLWDWSELCHVLCYNMGTEKVEAIIISQNESRGLNIKAISSMTKLKILVILGSSETDDLVATNLESLSNELRLLQWNGFPFETFPQDFRPDELVNLILHESNIKSLWSSFIMPLYKLRVIDLRYSGYFCSFEDFSVVPNLEELLLMGCSSLLEINSSIKALSKLIILNLSDCTSLASFPTVEGLNSLKTLILQCCSKLSELPEHVEHLMSLEKLDARGSAIKYPSSMEFKKKLKTFFNDEITYQIAPIKGFEKMATTSPSTRTPTRVVKVNLPSGNLRGMSSRSVDNPMKKYDVFLSFRGIDTRNGFTSYLHYALERENYIVFNDNEELERGSPIKEALPEAIENSRSSILIISENYASSTACLKELAKIVECNKTWGHIIIPVFYHVEPSHVKNLQIPSYKKEFAKYSKNPKYEFEEVQSWKDSLATVCGFAGWIIYEFMDNEAKKIKKIIANLQKILHTSNQSRNDGPSRQSTLPDVADVDRSLQIMKLNKANLPFGNLLGMSSRSVDNPMKDYDVFLSFRGLDTRNSFTSWLYYALQQEDYRVFIDDEELERGTPTREALPEAIEKSQSSILIISENYASSTACLKELAKIVECNKSWGQIVIPVFYRVEPSHVKNLQIPSYKKEFAKYSKNPKYEFEEVQGWKDALATVCGLDGWAIDELDNEGQMIKRIIAKLQKRLHVLNQSQNDGLSRQSSLPDVADVDHSLEIMKSNKVNLPCENLRLMKKLDLRGQNISDKAFPDHFDCLVSLEELNLGDNPFTVLPQSIKALSKLRKLYLDNCDRLTHLGPELPSSLEMVNVNYCISLESFLDPNMPSHLHCSAFCVDCHELVDKQGSIRTALTAMKRFLKNFSDSGQRFGIVLPGNEIPEWFREQRSGPSISKKLTPGWCDNGFEGFALAVCFKSNSSKDFFCDMKIDDREKRITFPLCDYDAISYRHLWLFYYSACSDDTPMPEWNGSLGNLEISFHAENDSEACFRSCGLRLVYKKDIEKFNRIVN